MTERYTFIEEFAHHLAQLIYAKNIEHLPALGKSDTKISITQTVEIPSVLQESKTRKRYVAIESYMERYSWIGITVLSMLLIGIFVYVAINPSKMPENPTRLSYIVLSDLINLTDDVEDFSCDEFTPLYNEIVSQVNTGNYDVQVTISNVNGNGGASYTLNKDIQVLGAVFPKTVVYEEGTGTWCGWCTRGLVGLSTMANTHANDGTWIGIGVHNADPMTVAAYDTEIGNFIGGYPSGIMDRHNVEVDPGLASLTAAYDQHVQINPEAKIEITGQTWNDASRAFTVDVATTFALDMNGADYNTALIVLENGVTGGNGYEQANYYDDGAAGPLVDWDGFNYVGAGDPIPAANMVYDHVARQLVDGWDGSANSVPTNVVFNTANPFNYSGSIPAAHDETETEFVALIINNATGEIVNATHAALNIPVGINIINNSNFNIYPNPTTGMLKIRASEKGNYQITIFDISGQVVFKHNLLIEADRVAEFNLSDLPIGAYSVQCIGNEMIKTERLIIVKE